MRQLQHDICDYIAQGSSYVPDDIVSNFVDSGDRLDIHKNNYYRSLSECLANNFPVTEKIVGKEFFNYLASFFISEYPPKSRLLCEYGEELPFFLTSFAPSTHLKYLPDVAYLELLWSKAYYSHDLPLITIDKIKSFGEEGIFSSFKFHPSVNLMISGFAVSTIWQVHQDNSVDYHEKIYIDRPVKLVVYRNRDLITKIVELTEGEYQFMANLLDGMNFQKSYELSGEFIDPIRLNELWSDVPIISAY